LKTYGREIFAQDKPERRLMAAILALMTIKQYLLNSSIVSRVMEPLKELATLLKVEAAYKLTLHNVILVNAASILFLNRVQSVAVFVISLAVYGKRDALVRVKEVMPPMVEAPEPVTIVKYMVEREGEPLSMPEMAIAGRVTVSVETPKYLGIISRQDTSEFVGNCVFIKTNSEQFAVTAHHNISAFVSFDITNPRNNNTMTFKSCDFQVINDDLCFMRLVPSVSAYLGVQPAEPAQLNKVSSISILYLDPSGKCKSSSGTLVKSENARVFLGNYSSVAGASGAAIVQSGKLVGIHNGARPSQNVNYFTSLFTFVNTPRLRKQKISVTHEHSSTSSEATDSWEDDSLSVGEVISFRHTRSKWDSFDADDRYLVEAVEGYDERDARALEMEIKDVMDQGYARNSPQVKQAISEVRRRRHMESALANARFVPKVRLENSVGDADFDRTRD